MNTVESFFYNHAGHSYNPDTETSEQGRERCARALADAERKAHEAGFSFSWSVDDVDSSEFSDEEPPRARFGSASCATHSASRAGVSAALTSAKGMIRGGKPTAA